MALPDEIVRAGRLGAANGPQRVDDLAVVSVGLTRGTNVCHTPYSVVGGAEMTGVPKKVLGSGYSAHSQAGTEAAKGPVGEGCDCIGGPVHDLRGFIDREANHMSQPDGITLVDRQIVQHLRQLPL